MRFVVALLLLVVGAGVIALGASATGADALLPCNTHTDVLCRTVVVPLDPSAQHPGELRLHVEVLRPAPRPGGPAPVKALFFIAGGPGQGSADAFGLIRNSEGYQRLFPGYTLVAYDDRGTGRSGALSCNWGGATGSAFNDISESVGACGRSLGSRRVFYSTLVNAADTDAVRRSLGLDRITLLGVSYGTAQALAYAAAYPTHVARLILDSVAPPNSDDVFALNTIKAIRSSLGALCDHGACRGVTRDAAGDLGRLANMLQDHPLVARVPAVTGRTQTVRIDGNRLLVLAVDSDLNAGVAAELPAAVSAALAGRPRLLARLATLETSSNGGGGLGINQAVQVATNCADGIFPWSPVTPVHDRPAIFDTAAAAVRPAAIAPFGSWVTSIGSAVECQDWPAPSGGTLVKSGPYPDVPVLILSGSRDIRTPEFAARAVARQFPRSRLLVVNGAGHSLFESSVCATRFVGAWMQGGRPSSCPKEVPELGPIGPFPPPSGSTTTSWRSARTYSVARTTLQEAEATWLTMRGFLGQFSGLFGGTLTPLPYDDPRVQSFRLDRYCDVPGLTLTGTISYRYFTSSRWLGSVSVRVKGSKAAGGMLVASQGRLSGFLGGKRVRRGQSPPDTSATSSRSGARPSRASCVPAASTTSCTCREAA